MVMSRVRLVPIVFIAIISLAVLFGGWQAYQHYGLVSPIQTTLKQLKYVDGVKVDTGSPTVVTIQLNSNVKDLQYDYDVIVQDVQNEVGGTYAIKLLDRKNEDLTTLYESIQPVIGEGLVHGNYTEMMAAVDALAAKAGVDYRFTMDQHNVFVQLKKGNNFLYDVVPLHQGGVTS
jgi:hypothetical protein